MKGDMSYLPLLRQTSTGDVLIMKFFEFFYASALAVAPGSCLAQQASLTPPPANFAGSAPDTAAPSIIAPAAVIGSGQQVGTASSPWERELDRWVNVKEMSFSSRYRSETASDDTRFFANGQQRSIVDGRIKLDAAARYTVNFHLSSGQTFNWAYSDVIKPDFATIAGSALGAVPLPVLQKLYVLLAAGYQMPVMPSRGWEMTPRQLFFSATPVDWLTAEYGSLGIDKGKGSEITTYDDDGYLTGERIRLQSPKHLYLDEIAVTYAFEGDVLQPNFIDRGDHLKKSNYHQFLVSKNVSKRLGASADYTFDKKTHTVREAAYIKLPETKALDAVRAEFYQRLNTVYAGPLPLASGSGFGLTAEKALFHRLKLDAGYEQVDSKYGATVDNQVQAVFGFSMNGDSYSTGKHVFAHANVKLTPSMSLTGFYIHQTVAQPTGEFGFVKEGFNGGLNIDLKSLLTKARVM
jgi:hypothetical protein